MNDTRREDED
ncbi:Protein of unknown function [Bacillus cereus]|nr:Protein of unknown function [Bacillus cereus]